MPATEFPAPARPAHLSTPELQTELLGLAGHIAAAQCRFLQLLAEFDKRGGWAGVGVRSCAHWLTWRIGMSLRTATEHLRVARALTDLPAITEAFAAGRISFSKVRAITRVTGRTGAAVTTADADPPDAAVHPVATDPEKRGQQPDIGPRDSPSTFPSQEDAETVLLNLALGGTASHVETVVRALRRRRTEPAAVAAHRSLTWHWAADGSLVVRGRFTPDDGAAFIAAVDALVPPREPVAHPVPSPPPDWRERASETAPGAVVDQLAARRADALARLVLEPAPGSDVTRGRARVVVHIDAAHGTARLDGGPEIPAATAERLACDAHAQVLLEDKRHNRLYLGRRRRLASPAQIVALSARDEGRCRFPGCRATRHLRAHHVVTWLRGGPTDIDNLVLLCGFHHSVLHDHGYLIRRCPTGWETLRPDGTPVPATGAPLGGNVERLIEIDTRAGSRIVPGSLTPTWAGERLDPEPILDALLPRERPTATAA